MELKLTKYRIGIALNTDVCFKSDFQRFSYTFSKDCQTSIRDKYVKNHAKTMVFTSPIAMRPYRFKSCFLSLSVLF